jgi:hypothetical protein
VASFLERCDEHSEFLKADIFDELSNHQFFKKFLAMTLFSQLAPQERKDTVM